MDHQVQCWKCCNVEFSTVKLQHILLKCHHLTMKPIWHLQQNGKRENNQAKEKSTRWHVLWTQGKACGFTCLTSLASGGVSGICVASMAPPGKVYSRMAHWKTKTIARLTKQLFSSVTTTILALASLLKSLLTFEMSKQVVQAYVSWQTREACDNKETVLFPSSLTTSIFATELSSHFPSQDCILWHICSFMVSLSNHLSHVRRWLKTASAGK